VENRYRLEAGHGESPERLFERGWALAVLDEAMGRLANECSASGRKAVFDQLLPMIGGDRGDSTRAQLAARLGLSENALNLSLLRLRRRYGELIREVIAGTVANPKETEEELRFLMQAVRG
jgi:RNA polymerase sigma-70 factor (ECF subfamily)